MLIVACVLAVAFFLAARYSGRRRTWLAAAAWTAYAGYEWAMYARLLCTGECNIRIDLFLILPALLVVSLVGAAAAWRGRRPPP